MRVHSKTVEEFGRTVTLYRATTDDGAKGTLWHRDRAKAVSHYERLAPMKGWV